jgi:hypothetical protein
MGHGEQWGAIFGDDQDSTTPLLYEVLESGRLVAEADVELRGDDGVLRTESGLALAYPATPLRYLALCATNSAGPEMTRFSECLPGVRWRDRIGLRD